MLSFQIARFACAAFFPHSTPSKSLQSQRTVRTTKDRPLAALLAIGALMAFLAVVVACLYSGGAVAEPAQTRDRATTASG